MYHNVLTTKLNNISNTTENISKVIQIFTKTRAPVSQTDPLVNLHCQIHDPRRQPDQKHRRRN